MIRSAILAAIGVLALATTGCQNKVAQERDELWRQNRQLQAQNAEMRQRLGMSVDAEQVKALQGAIAQRDAEIADLKARLRQPAPGGSGAALEGIDVTYDAAAGTITANLPGDVLFDSGQATLKPTALATLDKLVTALKTQYAGKPIRVEGHTDSDPILRTAGQWKDNLDLSLERAATVTRYLQSKGIDPKRIATVGYGQYRPKGSNKAANRRVEVVVVMK